MIKKPHITVAVLAIATLLSIGRAGAQVAPPAIPAPAVPDAGQILKPAPEARPAAPSPVMPAPGGALPDTRLEGTHVRFQAVRVSGATVVSTEAIAAIFAPLRDKNVSAEALRACLDQVQTLYADAGYPLGRAYIPAQRLQGRTLTVRIVEGYIANLAVQSDSDKTRRLVEGMAAPLTAEKPLTGKTLQRVLLLLQDIPGITLGSRFQAMDPQTGATTLLLAAKITPLSATFYMDNRANLDGLPVQPYLIAAANNLFGAGDQLSLTALLSPRQKDYAFYSLGYSQFVGTDGLNMGLNASWAQSLDERTFAPFPVRSQTSQLSHTARYPVIRGTERQFNLDGKLYFTHAGYSFAGIPIARDNFTALRLGGDYARSLSDAAAFGGSLHLTQGLFDTGGAAHTRGAALANFTKLHADARLVYKVTGEFSLNLRAAGQYGSGSLFASEEINFGGLQYGRGFDTSELAGDSGFGLTFQPEYTFAFSQADFGLGAGLAVTPFMMVDYAKTYNSPGDGQAKGELLSAGLGVRLAVAKLATVTLELAKPVNRKPFYRRDRAPRFYVGLEFGMDQAYRLMAGNL